MGLIDNY